jgi:Raf kinase inhibitor-like YbhB/YbcL family protein
MADGNAKKNGAGMGIWIALGVFLVLIVIGLANSGKKAPQQPSPETAQTTLPAPAQLPAPIGEKTRAASIGQKAVPLATPATRLPAPGRASAPPAAPATLDVGKNLAGTLKLRIPVLEAAGAQKRLPLEYTCYRSNISPPLQWEGEPKKTKSFAVFLERDEKDKPPFLKWIVFNIPATATGLPANLPKQADASKDGTAQALSDQGAAAYVGPCDPQGKVEYVFRLFALDTVLKAPAGASKDELIRAMNGHIIDVSDVAVVHYLRF